MLSYNELRAGVIFVIDGQPYEVLDYEFLRMQQRKPVAKTRLKNLITGKITERNFHQNETFAEAEIEKEPIKFLYNHRGEYWFSPPDNPVNRFSIKEDQIGSAARFLKANTVATAIKFNGQIISIMVPIKIDLLVKETPPGERGNTAQGGTKTATLETGVIIAVPLFVNTGDLVKINTQTGEYVERVEKSKE